MSKWSKEELDNMLEDVVNELELSDSAVEKHGQLGTAPSELVRLVLEEKDLRIRALEANFVDASKSNCNKHSVSQRSELLAFMNFLFENWQPRKHLTADMLVDAYLKAKCG